jgi:hypothetical protein
MMRLLLLLLNNNVEGPLNPADIAGPFSYVLVFGVPAIKVVLPSKPYL